MPIHEIARWVAVAVGADAADRREDPDPLIDRLGIDTADIGLPGAGPHVVRDVERLAKEIADQRLTVAANCAARTVIADITPIAEISQRVGMAIEACTFIGSSPLRQYAEGWTLDQLLR